MSLALNSIFPFRRLPTELKSRTFTFLVKIEEEDQWVELPNRAISLADVCREWREFIWSTPQMWTTITVDFWMPDCGEILDLYMKNSKSLPVDIIIVSNRDREILSRLASNAKIQSLDLCFEVLHRIGDLQSHLPHLEKVVLRYLDTVGDLFILHLGQMFNSSPALRDLNIEGVSLKPDTMACFTQVTTLKMSAVAVEECLNAISNMPNLTHLYLDYLWIETSSDLIRFHNGSCNFVHNLLTTLELEYMDNTRVIPVLFRHISCPSLKRLTINLEETEDENNYLDATTYLLRASNCPLTHLDLSMSAFRSGIWSLLDTVHTTLETLK